MFIILNNQNKSTEFKLNLNKMLPDGNTLKDMIDEKTFNVEDGIIDLPLEPYQILILKKV
jgi:hypothetical protein